jgi:hypothetical protein
MYIYHEFILTYIHLYLYARAGGGAVASGRDGCGVDGEVGVDACGGEKVDADGTTPTDTDAQSPTRTLAHAGTDAEEASTDAQNVHGSTSSASTTTANPPSHTHTLPPTPPAPQYDTAIPVSASMSKEDTNAVIASVLASTKAGTGSQNIFKSLGQRLQVRMCMCVCVCLFVCACMHVCGYIHVCMYACV